MSTLASELTQRERELGAIITAYNEVTERLKQSHEQLSREVKRLREELSRKNRQLRRRERLAALGELAAGVAHEIRNPLGGIQMFASLLRKDLQDRPDALRIVDKITTGVSRLESIVTQILDFGRPSEPEPQRVRLDALIGEVIDLCTARPRPRPVQITADAVEPVTIVTDGTLLSRALLNLVLNAADAAGEGAGDAARVSLSVTSRADGSVTISVSDNGPGIPPEMLDRIFNPFFTTKDHGTGLGLAIVHQIAETLGGSIQAANRPEGGAVFSLSLPAVLAVDESVDVGRVTQRATARVAAAADVR